MGWLSTVDATNTIVVQSRTWQERHILTSETSEVRVRTNESATTHYIGLTKSAAERYVASHSGDAGVVSIYAERQNEAGAYRVVCETVTWGGWAAE